MTNNRLTQEEIKQQAGKVYKYMLKDHSGNWGMDIHHWDWVPGVGVVSMLEYGQQAQDRSVLDWLINWTRTNLDQSEQKKVINSMAPFAIFPALYRDTKDEILLQTAIRTGQWMLHEAPRTREGAFEHTVTENASFPEQVWADTIFMAVLFLARLSRLTQDVSYGEEALKQLELHLTLLQDKDTGVLFHGWNCISQDHMSAARWTRANAWIAVATPMILQELEGWLSVPEIITDRYRSMMLGLLRFQQEDGLWCTVMDEPEFYRETSGSAGIACGILKAVRMGLLEEQHAEKAWQALDSISALIGAEGVVNGVSGGTPVMPSIQAYNEIPVYPALYGQGLTLMLLAEAMAWK